MLTVVADVGLIGAVVSLPCFDTRPMPREPFHARVRILAAIESWPVFDAILIWQGPNVSARWPDLLTMVCTMLLNVSK